MPVKPRKERYDEKMRKLSDQYRKIRVLLNAYSKILVVVSANVQSNQMHNIRKGLRGHSSLLMGKKTITTKCIEMYAERTGNQAVLGLLPLPAGPVGLIFTKADFKEVTEEVAKHTVDTPDRSLKILKLYDGGSVFSPGKLHLTGSSMSLTSPSLAISQPTLPEPSDTFINAYKNVPAVTKFTDYTVPQAEKDPNKFAVASTSAFASPAAAAAPATSVDEKKESAEQPDDEFDEESDDEFDEESDDEFEDESDDDMGLRSSD